MGSFNFLLYFTMTQTFEIALVTAIISILYSRVKAPYLGLWRFSWLSLLAYTLLAGLLMFLFVSEEYTSNRVFVLIFFMLVGGYSCLFFLDLGSKALVSNKKFPLKMQLKWLAFIVFISAVLTLISTQLDKEIGQFITILMLTLVSGIVSVIVGLRILKSGINYTGARVFGYMMIAHGVIWLLVRLEHYLVFAGVLPIQQMAVIAILLDIFIQLIMSLSIISWVLQHEHEMLNEATAKLQHIAWHDNLTQLPNRQWFTDKSQAYLDSLADQDMHVALIFIDLDGFKKVNDQCGHKVGDQLLVDIGQILLKHIGSRDKIARMGGDEFVWLAVSETSRADIINRANELRERLEQIKEIETHAVQISCSQGLTWFPEHSFNLETLIQLSDKAMYQAKKQGKAQLIEVS
jgi:diguanylate cyclase (GGDEF)-like protein